jgi:hypothetical protein
VATPNRKLYGLKQIALIAGSGLVGIGFFLYRRYYETGTLGRVELFASLVTVIMLSTITFALVRLGNRED